MGGSRTSPPPTSSPSDTPHSHLERIHPVMETPPPTDPRRLLLAMRPMQHHPGPHPRRARTQRPLDRSHTAPCRRRNRRPHQPPTVVRCVSQSKDRPPARCTRHHCHRREKYPPPLHTETATTRGDAYGYGDGDDRDRDRGAVPFFCKPRTATRPCPSLSPATSNPLKNGRDANRCSIRCSGPDLTVVGTCRPYSTRSRLSGPLLSDSFTIPVSRYPSNR